MKNNTKLLLAGLLATGGLLVACGDSSGTGGTGGATSSTTATTGGPSTTATSSSTKSSSATTTTSSTGSGGGFPMPPTLGTHQIDRMGRPAINTALDETFVAVNSGTPTLSTDAIRGAAEDKYNQDAVPTHWSTYQPTFETQLGILDGLDNSDDNTTECGNQLLSCGNHTTVGCYHGLAVALSDDRLWVKTTSTSCTLYLGVEADATNAFHNTDCGGRRPVDDVIKTSYSVLAAGSLAGAVDDGITPPAGLHPTTFPYLAAPHP